MSKYTIRIPTKDTYAYIEEVYEGDDIKGRYDELFNLMNGVSYSDSNFLDDLLIIVKNNLHIEGGEAIEKYQGFSDKQKLVLKEIKNLVARAVRPYKPEK